MTKTTEELKREYARAMHDVMHHARAIGPNTLARMREFEDAVEEYLEQLRQEMAANSVRLDGENERNKILLDAYRQQQDLTSQARTEADQLRNRLQAFEFANKSAGEMLQAANEKIKRQRQSIGQLKNDRNNAQSLAAVNYEKYQKARRELSELRKAQCSTRSVAIESDRRTWEELGGFIWVLV